MKTLTQLDHQRAAEITRDRETAAENAAITAMLDAFDAAWRCARDCKRLRADFKSAQVAARILAGKMHAVAARDLVLSFLFLSNVWFDLTGTPGDDRIDAGEICVLIARRIRKSRGLGGGQ